MLSQFRIRSVIPIFWLQRLAIPISLRYKMNYFEVKVRMIGPDLCYRVYRVKLNLLLKHLKEDESFGKVISFVSVIDFRKRGLMHTNFVAFLDEKFKFSTQKPTNIDNVILAEILSDTFPHLRELVLKHMIHYPCTENPTARCIRGGRCSKRLPKPFQSDTTFIEGDSYVSYGRTSTKEGGEANFSTGNVRVSGPWRSISLIHGSSLILLICSENLAIIWMLNYVFPKLDLSILCSNTFLRANIGQLRR